MTPRYVKHAELRVTALEGEGVALHLGSRRYFTVTETGLSILQALDTPRSFDEIVNCILAEYEVAREHAATSVRTFLDQCLESSLVREDAA